MKIGFIGLGTMGRPMVINLLKAGHSVRAYNRTASKIDAVVAEGANAASSCADAALGSDVVITNLSDSPVVRDAILGKEGALSACAPGATIIDMSTISPDTTVEIARACEEVEVGFLDAPVTGGEWGAIAGTLSIMVGGDKDTLERVRPVLEVLGSKITYMGCPGKGQAAKLCNQVAVGLGMIAACEALALGVASGLDPNTLIEAISGGAAGSWTLSNLAPRMIAEDWAPGFRTALLQKDLRLVLESACRLKLPLTGTALTHQLCLAAKAAGIGDEGTQALFKIIKGLGATA